MRPSGGKYIIAESTRSHFTDIPEDQRGTPLTLTYVAVRNDATTVLRSNDIQDRVIESLIAEYPGTKVVPHCQFEEEPNKNRYEGNKYRLRCSALVEVPGYNGARKATPLWIDAFGNITDAQYQDHHCYGPKGYAACIAAGRCLASRACND